MSNLICSAHIRRAACACLYLVLISGITACVAPIQATPTPLCDFYKTVTIRTWVDANQNNVWDAGESPLKDVTVWAKETPSTHGNRERLTEAVSDAKGESKLDIFLAGCPKVKVEIFAVTPQGFQVATRDDGVAVTDGKLSKEEFLFGFVPTK